MVIKDGRGIYVLTDTQWYTYLNSTVAGHLVPIAKFGKIVARVDEDITYLTIDKAKELLRRKAND